MFELFFQEPDVVVRYVFLFLAALFAVVGAAGHRTLAVRGLLCSLAALCCGVMLFAITAFLSLIAVGRSFDAAIASVMLGTAVGGIGSLLALAILLWRFVWRPRDAFVREGVSIPFAALAILSVALAAITYYARTPTLHSNQKLARNAKESPAMESQYAELARRGRAAATEIIQQLQKVPESKLRDFESGENGGTKKLLILLGQAGGLDAVVELRLWLQHPVAAPDIRGIAALALAEAGDRESAPAIATLLRENSYEWHKQRPLLFRALARLKAAEQTNTIAAALMLENNEIYRMDGAGALVEIGGRKAGVQSSSS